jgi:hypothetical protein
MKKIALIILLVAGVSFSSNYYLPSGASNAKAITPSDSVTFEEGRTLWVGDAGTVNVLINGDSSNTTTSVICPTGALFSVPVKRVNATGTTATRILGLW